MWSGENWSLQQFLEDIVDLMERPILDKPLNMTAVGAAGPRDRSELHYDVRPDCSLLTVTGMIVVLDCVLYCMLCPAR